MTTKSVTTKTDRNTCTDKVIHESRSAKCKGHKKQKIMINLRRNSNALKSCTFIRFEINTRLKLQMIKEIQ